jgi:hypothetical protein
MEECLTGHIAVTSEFIHHPLPHIEAQIIRQTDGDSRLQSSVHRRYAFSFAMSALMVTKIG